MCYAEFIETQKFGIGEIAKIYKIPPHKLGQLDRATFSNIEHRKASYDVAIVKVALNTIKTWLDQLEELQKTKASKGGTKQMNKSETRHVLHPIEVRSEKVNGQLSISGYVLKFNERSKLIMGNFMKKWLN